MERCSGAAFLKLLGRGSVRKEVADAVFLKFERGFICGIRPAKLAARKPASIERLRASRPETHVNSGLEDRSLGNAHKQCASGQPFRRCPFYAGFRTCPFAYHETAPADAWHNSRKTVDTCRTKIIPITFLDLLEASLGADWKNAGFVTLCLWRVFSRCSRRRVVWLTQTWLMND